MTMYLGPKTPHVRTGDDLTIVFCPCGWHSKEFPDKALLSTLGVPWYCDDCGKKTGHWVTFHPTERAAAYAIVVG